MGVDVEPHVGLVEVVLLQPLDRVDPDVTDIVLLGINTSLFGSAEHPILEANMLPGGLLAVRHKLEKSSVPTVINALLVPIAQHRMSMSKTAKHFKLRFQTKMWLLLPAANFLIGAVEVVVGVESIGPLLAQLHLPRPREVVFGLVGEGHLPGDGMGGIGGVAIAVEIELEVDLLGIKIGVIVEELGFFRVRNGVRVSGLALLEQDQARQQK